MSSGTRKELRLVDGFLSTIYKEFHCNIAEDCISLGKGAAQLPLIGSVSLCELLERADDLVKPALGLQGQRVLAHNCCPTCFGPNLKTGNQLNPKLKDCLIICLDGNFQHMHHKASSKNHTALMTPNLFVKPVNLEDLKKYIDELEVTHKIPKTKK
jgi:hypothetical protein